MSAKILKTSKPGLALLLIPFFFACDDPLSSGIELQNEQPKIESHYIEFTLPASTVYIDSLRTNQTETALFGDFTDSIYGRTQATAFLKYHLGNGTIPNDTIDFVRVFMALGINEALVNGTVRDEVLNIYEADDSLYTTPKYLSSNITPYGSSGLFASHSFDYSPGIDSVIQVELPTSFGQILYTQLYNYNIGKAYSDSLVLGLYYYPPLVLEPGATNQGLYSIDFLEDTTAIYIEMVGISGKKFYYQFRFSNTAHYTQINRDRSSGKLSDLVAEYTESTTPSTRTYLNPIAGIHTKLSLEPFLNFLDTTENIIINQADFAFLVEPKAVSYLEVLSPIQMFFLSDSTRINGTGKTSDNLSYLLRTSAVMDEASYSGSKTLIQNTAYFESKSWFRGRMTLFLQDFATRKNNGDTYLTEDLLIHTLYPLSTRRTSFIKSEMKLRVFYTKLK